MWSSCESDEREPATSGVNKNRSKEGEKPRTCEPTGTLSRSPVVNTCIWADSRLDGRATPTVESLQEQNEKVLQKLRESVTRVRTTAQKMQSAGYITGGTSDRVHLMDTPEGRVSMQASGTLNSLGRGVLSPTGCNDAGKLLCPNGTGAQGSTVKNTGGRDVKAVAQRGASLAVGEHTMSVPHVLSQFSAAADSSVQRPMLYAGSSVSFPMMANTVLTTAVDERPFVTSTVSRAGVFFNSQLQLSLPSFQSVMPDIYYSNAPGLRFQSPPMFPAVYRGTAETETRVDSNNFRTYGVASNDVLAKSGQADCAVSMGDDTCSEADCYVAMNRSGAGRVTKKTVKQSVDADSKQRIADLCERIRQLELAAVAGPVQSSKHSKTRVSSSDSDTVGSQNDRDAGSLTKYSKSVTAVKTEHSRKTRKCKKSLRVQKTLHSTSDSDSDERRTFHYIKPMKFDGSGSFETFLAHFLNCADHNRWYSTEKLAQLKSCLTKDAGQVLWDSTPETVDTFDKLVELLKNRFSGTRQSDKYRMELRVRKRKPNESLSSLHQDIRRLIALAHPDFPASAREVMASDYFIDSLGDPQFALKIRERNPSSLDDTLRVALQLEAYQKDAERHGDASADEVAKLRGKPVRSVKVENEKVSTLEAELSAMRKELTELKACSQRNISQSSFPVQVGWQSAQPPLFSGMPMGRMSQNIRDTAPKLWAPRRCFNCGDHSHFKRDCPYLSESKNTSYSNAPRQVQQGNNNDQSMNAQARGSSSMQGGRVYLQMKLKGEKVDCLLDSGSEVTLMPLCLLKKHRGIKMNATSKRIFAANRTELEIAGEAIVPLYIGGKCVFAEAFVTEDIDEVMLGIDFLSKNKCVWDFARNTITIQGITCILSSRPAPMLCRRIFAVNDVVLPPKHQTNVVVRATLNSLTETSETWLTEPLALQAGVYVSQTLLPDKHKDIMVRVINTTPELRLITRGSYLGVAEPVDVPTKDDAVAETAKIPASRKVLDSLPSDLNELQRKQISDLLSKYEAAFSQHDYDIGRTHLVEHTIDTGNHRPIRQPLRRHPVAHLEIIDKQVDEMLKYGVIEPAASPWASNVVLARKKDNSMRICIDYRKINQISYQDSYPLPHIDVCLSSLQGSSWFSTLDLSSGYFNIPVKESDKDKTCFITRRGSWRFNVLPFGLTSAPSVFQRLMDLSLSGLSYVSCLAYIDDILVYSTTFEQHLERLEEVLLRILNAGLKLKASKCHVFQRKVEFLGHIVSADGIEVQPSKVSAVLDWPRPTNLHELRSFVGFCSYYRRFVQGFANLAFALHTLMRKNVKFYWGPEQEEAFVELKRRLVTAPVLTMPRDEGEYVLDTDASNVALGAVLSQMQEGIEKPIAYASRSLSKSERMYCTTRKELLAVVFGLKQYKHYVLGRPLRIRTDHSALQWLRRTTEPVAQQARWLEFIEQFQYSIEHRPGHRHGNADALSRIPVKCSQCTHCDEPETEVNDDQPATVRATKSRSVGNAEELVDPSARETLAQAQQADPEIGPLVRLRLTHDQLRPLMSCLLSRK
jgi:hypothetical protein